MSPEIANTKSQAPSVEFCEVRFGAEILIKPASDTVNVPEPSFEQIKHLCSDKPLRFARRAKIDDIETLEDQIDVKNALESLKDKGSIGLDDFKKQLGI
jgi:hypothetical protein